MRSGRNGLPVLRLVSGRACRNSDMSGKQGATPRISSPLFSSPRRGEAAATSQNARARAQGTLSAAAGPPHHMFTLLMRLNDDGGCPHEIKAEVANRTALISREAGADFTNLGKGAKGLIDGAADCAHTIRRVVYWSNRIFAPSKRAIVTMEAHCDRGFVYGFLYRGGVCRVVFPAREMSTGNSRKRVPFVAAYLIY